MRNVKLYLILNWYKEGIIMIEAKDWKLKYRPKTLDEVILTKRLRAKLQGFKEGKAVQNMLFHGSYGVGKTSCSLLLRDNIDTYFINCSEQSSIDQIRQLIVIGTSYTISGNRRLIILDELEKLSKEAFKVLRGVIEKLSVTNDFILIANNITNIDPAILSRVEIVSFDFNLDLDLKEQIQTRVCRILELESINIKDQYGIEIDGLIKFYYKDIRNLIGKLQNLSFEWNLI